MRALNSHDHSASVDVVAVAPRPSNRLLRKALWVNTWLLLSLAVVSKQLSAAEASNSLNVDAKGFIFKESQELEVSDDYDINHESSFTKEHILDGEPTDEDNDKRAIIVVATVDGSIAGLSRQTGQVIWRQNGVSLMETDLPSSNDTNNVADSSKVLSPLVSTTTTTKSSSHDSRTAAVPSVDGRVFLTAGRDKELTATSTLKELVARAPFVDSRGRFYVGSRQASAAAMDRETGEVLRVVTGGDVSTASGQGQDHPEFLEGRKIVWVGRVDYSISLFDARSGAMDVKFSSSEIMGVQDMMVDDINDIGSQPHAPRLMLPTKEETSKQMAMLVATPNGNVALRNAETGAIDWVSSETFDTPVVFALETSTGASLGVDILPDAPLPNSSPEYLAIELERQMHLIVSSDEPEQTIVGALSSGQLFAMPLGKRLSQTKQHLTSFGLPHSTSPSSSSAVGFKATSSKLLNLGKTSAVGTHSHKTDEHSKVSALAKKTCVPTNPSFPACLVGGIHHNHDFASSLEGSFLDSDYVPNPTALLPFQQMHSMQNDLLELQQFRKNKRNFFNLMKSWLPPTMALIFVLSFEMGRRIKAKKRKERETVVSQITAIESTSSISDVFNNSNGVRNVGVIQVTDDVLGFGGHGTVVYRGTLDSRQVAVKRMLKAYHASADREISLLIESDGHPNVVRYFLKEVKGDFVYLALELCDMSLHDLIIKLRQHSVEAGPLRHSLLRETATATLYQIACGVRHLHSLRIVHRDLKPANILLALSGRTKGNFSERLVIDNEIIARYEQGGYIAKISDMGLGKQLAGQSSFGLSTLGNSSIQGSVNGCESSRLTGAGPGSVGWQAPEVMAIRWSAESSSVQSAGSSGRSDSLVEASPLDAGASLRTSRSVDIFSLGCIFYCTLVPGSHPFGDWYEREANIMRNRASTEDLSEVSPEAHDLISAMINRDPTQRPTAQEVCDHPFFWSPRQKLAFLCDISDRVEIDAQSVEEGREPSSLFSANIFAIERNASEVVGTAWDQCLDLDLVSNVSKFRTYDPSSVRDCLRLIRNKHHHYDELPAHVKENVGSNPDGLLSYFEIRFPRLLMHCYMIIKEFMEADDLLALKYSISAENGSMLRLQSKQLCSEVSDDPVSLQSETSRVPFQETIQSYPERTRIYEIDETPPVLDSSRCENSYNIIQNTALSIANERDPFIGIDKLQCDSTSSFLPIGDIVIWEGSTAAKTFKCRGWFRAGGEWTRKGDLSLKKIDSNLSRCASDPKFRTRLCNHWDTSLGTYCPMQKRNKCIFAHGPIELRVKEGKKTRWGKLVDASGNNSNPKHSGGEDTYGAARSIETTRKEEGKWNTDLTMQGKPRPKAKQVPSRKSSMGPDV